MSVEGERYGQQAMSPAVAGEWLVFSVEGMPCASCASGIERKLARQDGVQSAEVIRLSRRTYRPILQNRFWAFIGNTVLIPAAALGFLSPVLAGAAMAISSVTVVANSLPLSGFGRRWRTTPAPLAGRDPQPALETEMGRKP